MTEFTCPSCGAPVYSAATQAALTDARCAECAAKAHSADLGAALIEQARLGDAFERSVGTSSEQSSYVRLQESGRTVSACDRQVKADRRDALDRRRHVLQHNS